MSQNEPSRYHIRPFGLLGGQYEVDGAGMTKYVLGWIVVTIAGVGILFQESLGLDGWTVTAGGVAATLIALALCLDITRKGRKL